MEMSEIYSHPPPYSEPELELSHSVLHSEALPSRQGDTDGDLVMSAEEVAPTPGGLLSPIGDGLAPLPSSFDPDAPAPVLEPLPATEGEDDLALAPHDEDDSGGGPMEVNQIQDGDEAHDEDEDGDNTDLFAAIAKLQYYEGEGEGDGEEEEQGGEEEDEKDREGAGEAARESIVDGDGEIAAEGGRDSEIEDERQDLSQTMATTEANEGEPDQVEAMEGSSRPLDDTSKQLPVDGGDEDSLSVVSSPLTPIPELPSTLPDDEAPLPPFVLEHGAYMLSDSVAESSTDAQRRASTEIHLKNKQERGSVSSPVALSATRIPSEAPKPKRKAKKQKDEKEDDIATVGSDEEQLVDIDDDEKPKRTYKKRRGIDGKPIRTSTKPRKRLDAALGISRDGDRPPEKVLMRARMLTDAKIKELLKGQDTEIQLAPCVRPRYGRWGKCTQCVSKLANDSCRFRGFRAFPLDPKTAEIIAPGNFISTEWDGKMTPLPQEFNAALTEEHMIRTERTVAPLLINLITREMCLVVNNDAIFRGVDAAKHRSVCDFCASTIFGGFYFCRKCGREFCLQCERYFSHSIEALRDSPWSLPDAARPRLHKCTRSGNEVLPIDGRLPSSTFFHVRGDLQPTSRFKSEELRSNWLSLIDFVLEAHQITDSEIDESLVLLGLQPAETELAEAVRGWFRSRPHESNSSSAQDQPAISQEEVDALFQASTNLPGVPDPAGLESHPFMFIEASKLTDEVFNSIWARGQPIVVNGLKGRFKKDWTPDAFIANFGKESCSVVDCRTEIAEAMTIEQFFTLFKEASGRDRDFQIVPKVEDSDNAANIPIEGDYTGSTGIPYDLTRASKENSRRTLTEVTQNNGETPAVLDDSADFTLISTLVKGKDLSLNTHGTSTDKPVMATSSPVTSIEKENPMEIDKANVIDISMIDEVPPAASQVRERLVKDSLTASETASHENMAPISVMNVDRFRREDVMTNETPPAPSSVNIRAIDSEEAASAIDVDMAPISPPVREAKRHIWKLKDWPSTNDFASAYPELYQDFCDSLPVPDYTRREGVLNLYAHFPPGPTRPDIGPKMYNAFEAEEGPGGMGSTRLHMDVADAVNIMLYASPRRDQTPGCAVWDLFKAEDADAIRLFLKKRYSQTHQFTDPIHAQLFYLDSDLRRALFQEHGVTSFRVYQYPGQAVFIPAGCAHQVCNLANCIKIALDFVSPHNIRRCQKLTQDFRKENFVRAWKDDVLQLYNVMWYAWTNVRETRERRAKDVARAEAEQAARSAHLASLANGDTELFVNPHLRTDSPSRSFLSPALSSVRDDPPPPASPMEKEEQNDGEDESVASVKKNASLSGLAASDDAPPPAETEDEISNKELSPRRALARRLLDAALCRQPDPIAFEPTDQRGRPSPFAPVTDNNGSSNTLSAQVPVSLSEAIGKGYIPVDLAMSVIRNDLGDGLAELDEDVGDDGDPMYVR